MSLITRCPACETLFKVVPDQLRISEGWVRCGQCDEIFDASLHLLEAATDAGPLPIQHDEWPAKPAETDPLESMQEASDGGPDPENADGADELLAEPESMLAVDETHADPNPNPTPTPNPSPDPDLAESDAIDDMDDVSFLRERKEPVLVPRPRMRALWSLLTVVLLLGLSAQLVFHERDRIVALEPGLKPWLLAFCRPLQCTLSALRRIESIVIDSSSFSKIRGDSYRLTFTVKNSAAFALAVPAIELTLTDGLDQPVIRRVFLPSDLGLKSDALAAGAEWPASLAMTVKAAGSADRFTGYRLLAFYP